MKVFLDDIRKPIDCVDYMYYRILNNVPIYLEKWEIVRNYKEFIDLVSKNHESITHISFDHDLGEDVAIQEREKGSTKKMAREVKKDQKNGYDCAKWMKKFYDDKGIDYPTIYIHSMNPVGFDNIKNCFR